MIGLPTETTVVMFLNQQQHRDQTFDVLVQFEEVVSDMRREWFLSHGYDVRGKPISAVTRGFPIAANNTSATRALRPEYV